MLWIDERQHALHRRQLGVRRGGPRKGFVELLVLLFQSLLQCANQGVRLIESAFQFGDSSSELRYLLLSFYALFFLGYSLRQCFIGSFPDLGGIARLRSLPSSLASVVNFDTPYPGTSH